MDVLQINRKGLLGTGMAVEPEPGSQASLDGWSQSLSQNRLDGGAETEAWNLHGLQFHSPSLWGKRIVQKYNGFQFLLNQIILQLESDQTRLGVLAGSKNFRCLEPKPESDIWISAPQLCLLVYRVRLRLYKKTYICLTNPSNRLSWFYFIFGMRSCMQIRENFTWHIHALWSFLIAVRSNCFKNQLSKQIQFLKENKTSTKVFMKLDHNIWNLMFLQLWRSWLLFCRRDCVYKYLKSFFNL